MLRKKSNSFDECAFTNNRGGDHSLAPEFWTRKIKCPQFLPIYYRLAMMVQTFILAFFYIVFLHGLPQNKIKYLHCRANCFVIEKHKCILVGIQKMFVQIFPRVSQIA